MLEKSRVTFFRVQVRVFTKKIEKLGVGNIGGLYKIGGIRVPLPTMVFGFVGIKLIFSFLFSHYFNYGNVQFSILS